MPDDLYNTDSFMPSTSSDPFAGVPSSDLANMDAALGGGGYVTPSDAIVEQTYSSLFGEEYASPSNDYYRMASGGGITQSAADKSAAGALEQFVPLFEKMFGQDKSAFQSVISSPLVWASLLTIISGYTLTKMTNAAAAEEAQKARDQQAGQFDKSYALAQEELALEAATTPVPGKGAPTSHAKLA